MAPTVEIGRTDLGQDFRFGLRFAVFSGAIVLEGRHVRGMVDIEPGHHTHNRFDAITLGYEFRRR
jgi:hypothetical protein